MEQELGQKREKLRADIAEVRKLRPKVAGTEYAVLLEKVELSLAAQDAAFASPFWPQQPTLSSVSAQSEEQEARKTDTKALPFSMKSDSFAPSSSLQSPKVVFKPTLFSLMPDSNSPSVSPVADGETRAKYSLPKPDLFAPTPTANLWLSSPLPPVKSTLFPAYCETEKTSTRPAELTTQSSFPDSLSTFDSFPSRRRGKVLSSTDSVLTTSSSQPALAARTGRDRSHLLQEIEADSRNFQDFGLRDLSKAEHERDRKPPPRRSEVKPAPVLELEESDIML